MPGGSSLGTAYLCFTHEIFTRHLNCLEQEKRRHVGTPLCLGFSFFFMEERHLLRSWVSKGYGVCRKCVLPALPAPCAASTSTSTLFVSNDAVTPLCYAEVGAAAVQDDPFTAQVEESKYISE